MKISQVTIKNFQALQDISIPLQPFSVLIGENDSGKTSVLQALEQFYAGKKLSSPDDWCQRDTSQPIEISVTLSGLPEDDDIRKITDSGEITLLKRFALNATPEILSVVEGEEPQVASPAIRRLFSPDNFVFVPVQRGIKDHFAKTKTAVLGSLVRKKMQQDFAELGIDTRIREVEQALEDSVRGYADRLGEYMQQQADNREIKLEFVDFSVDPLAGIDFKTLISDQSSSRVPIENRGAGTQNNLIIALFRLVAEEEAARDIVYALEEPENSLHPKAQRQLYAAIHALSEQSQTIVTTHSPVFIDRGNYESNVWLTRHPETGCTRRHVFNEDMLESVRVDMGIMASDALLKGGGNCAVIVEGETEEEAFPRFMEAMKLSVFSLGVSIINVRGANIKSYKQAIKLLHAYDIPCVAVVDGDGAGVKVSDELNRIMRDGGDLPNLKEVYTLEKDTTMEDFYPLDVIVSVMNKNFTRHNPVDVKEFDSNKRGAARNEEFKKIMHEHKAGMSLSHLKRRLGIEGTEQMKDRPVPDKLQEIFRRVKDIAYRTED